MVCRTILMRAGIVVLTMPLAAAAQTVPPAKYTLKPTPKTIAWGYYDASTPPVLRIKSGETVEIQTLIASSPKRLEDAGVPAEQVEQSLREITKEVTNKGPGGHILTGPVFVGSAQAGDGLEGRIQANRPGIPDPEHGFGPRGGIFA